MPNRAGTLAEVSNNVCVLVTECRSFRGAAGSRILSVDPGMSNMALSVRRECSKLRAMDMNIPKIEIGRAQAEEADSAFALVEEYFVAIGVVVRENRQQFVEEYFGEGRGLWQARAEGELAGCVGLRKLRCPENNDSSATKCAEIKRMYVRENFRGRSVAQNLLAVVEEFARAAGYDWIYLDTTQEMKAAARLYQRNGFVRCERYNQNPQAAIFMCKNLK